MPEARFQDLLPNDRRDALEVVERSGSHKAHLLEKDVWVVATLGILFETPFAENLTFKGGTSLSKVWRASRRFSEDIDITYDIRTFAPDLVSGAGDEALPPTLSQEKRWTRAIRSRLAQWVQDEACPIVEEGLSDDYTRMLADGMLLDDNESFDMLMERCALLEVRANETKV